MKKVCYRILCAVLSISLLVMPATSKVSAAAASEPVVPAFPGAEGFGAYVTGGRGGEVYHVTTLGNDGVGSFRDAVTSGGDIPRTVVFDVYGYIDLNSAIKSTRSNLTIAGQTAPGGGVTVRGNSVTFSNASNIIVRNMRFRNGHIQGEKGADDSAYFHYCNGVIIDHCTFSWGTDENLSIKECRNVTLQWSIVSECMLPHSMGSLIEWNTISMHHNLYAHNNDRNPKSKGNIDFVNNIVYDWGVSPFVAGGESAGWSYVNVDSNYFIPGASTIKCNCGLDRGNSQFTTYLNKNLFDHNKDGILNGVDVGTDILEKGTSPITVVNNRYNYPKINTEDTLTAYNNVLNNAGASLKRDAIDARVIDSVRNQTGKLINNKVEGGGFCEIASGVGPLDTDKDGMPDSWESTNGLNTEDSSDGGKDRNGDGYTNLEDYLNELVVSEFPNSTPPAALAAAPSKPDAVNYKFDFGGDSTEVAQGYDRVSAISLYSPTGGYGFEGVRGLVTGSDRGAPNSLVQDFCNPTKSGDSISFKVDVPNGRHYVKMISGDNSNANETTVSIENGAVSDTLTSNAGTFAEKVWYVDVVDGQLNITLGKDGRINALEVCTIPSNLIKVSTSGSQVKFSWTPVKSAVNYQIYRAVESDGTYDLAGSSTLPEYTDSQVKPGETYYYKVSAVTKDFTTLPSEFIVISAVDTSVQAPNTPRSLHISKVKEDAVKLSWNKVDGALRYNIYRAEAQDGVYKRVGTSVDNKYTDSVKTSINYYYKVSAVNAGGESEKTKAIKSREAAVPSAPTDLKFHYVAAAGVSLNWTGNAEAEKYKIYRASKEKKKFKHIGTSTTPTFEDKTVTMDAYYEYMVSAVNSAGESLMSNTVITKVQPLEYKFDFGMQTSPVADGYIQIYGANVYNSQYGFNDISGISARDRKKSPAAVLNDMVARDFVLAKNKTFLVDVPSGTYTVEVVSGDGEAANVTTISVEGTAKDFKSAKGEVIVQTWTVDVTDGQLTVLISGDGRINGMVVKEVVK